MSDETNGATTAGGETFLELFQIRPDIPFDHAFEELSVLLGCIRHLTREAEMEGDRQAGSAARILSDFAKALINDMERGRSRQR
ncbi:MAG TPA: DUF3077 domain-containing protein [Pseudomonas sp.]|uniref:DUF3077 domain-containing protein n=1 Tax=Pseudomonas sp. TaxID=306 RepID=UPI002B4A5865|nr:DUF3077 domain-containing protein [Pseudomonas sp.]HKS11586.1 DUF3077 domain-containing protein [Pseudomonas sp.]